MRAHMPDARAGWWGNELTEGTGLAWVTEQKPLEARSPGSWGLGWGENTGEHSWIPLIR